jgi:hypothetical protein
VPPDTARCTRDSNSELLTFGNSGGRSAIIHRTVRCSTGQCPVCQRSNGYFGANGHLQLHSMRYSARRSQARTRRRTGQSTGPVRCTTGLFGGPEDRSSNGQNQRPGDVAGAPDSVRWRTGLSGAPCDSSLPQTASLVVGAINTPNHPPFITSKFSDFPHLTRAIAFNTRYTKEIKFSLKSLVHSKSNSDL